MNFRRIFYWAAAAGFAGALAVCVPACNRANANGAKPGAQRSAATVPVSLAHARVIPVQRSVDAVGTLYGEEETVVSAKVPGRIIALYKDVGDPVAPAEPLVQLKPNDYQLAVTKAELAMKEVLAKLGLKDLPPIDFDVTKIPTVVKARLQAENAEAKYNRGKKLFEAKPTPLMSEQDFSDLETALRVARSGYEVEMLNARALVASAWALKGDLDIASQRLTDATTRAPSTPEPTTQPVDTGKPPTTQHSYVVVARYVNVGELVREITPCYKLVDDNPIKLRAQVPERHVAAVKVGQNAKVRIEAYPNVDFPGTISRVNPQIDIANRAFSVEILIPNDDHRLKSGAFARAAVETTIEPNIVFVPQDAVVAFAGVNKVFTVQDGKAVEINVEPGEARTPDNYVEIAKGLKGNEQVVTSGTSKLATGVPVTVKGASSEKPNTNPQ
jgi:multidrug efflux pump subunit AcrA (membrane-fusion protein)